MEDNCLCVLLHESVYSQGKDDTRTKETDLMRTKNEVKVDKYTLEEY